MDDSHSNSDLLEDEELASLRLAALATLKHKKQSTTATLASENAVPDNSSANVSVNRAEAEPSQIPFLQSDRNAHNNTYSWRKQLQVFRRRGNVFPKTSHRSNLIVISPVSLDDSKGSDEKPSPALVLPQHKWCNSGNEDSLSPKTLRRTGPTRFNRHGSDSESSDSDYENSDNDSGSNETVLQDEPQEHFPRVSPERQKDAVPENVEKQRRLSFQNLESEIKTDAFDKNETTSVYNCLKNSSSSYNYTDNRSDNYPSSQNQSDDKHSWTYSAEKDYSSHKQYSGGHSYSTELSDPSSISGKRRNSSHINNGESCIDGVANYASHMSESSSWQHSGLETGNSYYSQESISESARNHGMNDRKSSMQICKEIQGSDSSTWQHGRERLRTNNQYFSRDGPYNSIDSRGFVDNDISSYSDSKNHSLSQNDLRRELKKRIQEYKGRDNQNEVVESRRQTDSWDSSRQRFAHREDRAIKDCSSYQFRNRQEGNSGRQRNRHTRSFSRERMQSEYGSNLHRRRHERSVSQDRNRQERSSSRDRIRHKHASVHDRNRYENNLNPDRNRYDRSSSQDRSKREHSSSQERSKRERSFSHDGSEHERSSSKERQKHERSSSRDRNKPEHSSNRERNKHEYSLNRDRSKRERSSSRDRSSHERSVSLEKNQHDRSTSRDRNTRERSYSRDRSRYQRSSSRSRSRRDRSSSRNRSRHGRSSSRNRSCHEHSSSQERRRDDRSSSHERRRSERSSSREKNQRSHSSSRRQRIRSASRDRNRHERSSSRSKSRHERSPSHSKGKQECSSIQVREEYCSTQSKNKKEHSPGLDQSGKDHGFNSEKSKQDLPSSQGKQEITAVLQKNRPFGRNQERFRQENRHELVNVQQLARSTERNRQQRSKSKEKYKEQSRSPLSRQSRKPSANDKEYYSRSRSRSSSSFSSSSSGSSSSHSSRPKIRSVPSVIKSVQSKSSDSGPRTFNDSKSAGKRSRSSSLSDCSTSPAKKRLLTDVVDHSKVSIVKSNRIDGDLKNASDGNKRVPVHMRLGTFPRKRVIQMTKDVEAAFVNSSSSSDGESVNTKSKRPNIRIVTDVFDSKNVLDNEKRHRSGKDKFEKKSPDIFREKSKE